MATRSRTIYNMTSQAAGDGNDLAVDKSACDIKMTSKSPSKCASFESIIGCTDELQGGANSTTHMSTSQAENKTNLIVNYLPPSISQEDVRAMFEDIGKVENCKLVCEKLTGESLGYAFVKYYTVSDAEKAIETLNGLKLENKVIKVSIARPSCDAIKGANLYICGLPRSLKTEELEEIFKSYGRIITTRILCDKKTSTSRGIAFIRYDRRCEAERAIEKLDGYKFPNTNDVMVVKFANSPNANCDGHRSLSSRSTLAPSNCRRKKKAFPGPATPLPRKSKYCSTDELLALPTRGHAPSVGFFQLKVPLCYTVKGSRGGPLIPPPQRPTPTAVPHLGVYGNEYSVPLPVGLNKLLPNPSWQQAHLGFCQLATWAYLQSPLSTSQIRHGAPHMSEVTTGVPLISFPIRHSSSQFHIPSRKADNLHSETDIPTSLKAMLAPSYAANAGALTTNGWRVCVCNLGAETDDAVLWQLFGPFGAVHDVDVVTDPVTGKCKGYGFVTMSNYDEALRAIRALSGFILGNRILQVGFKTNPYLPKSGRRDLPKCSGTNNSQPRMRHFHNYYS